MSAVVIYLSNLVKKNVVKYNLESFRLSAVKKRLIFVSSLLESKTVYVQVIRKEFLQKP